MILGTNTIRNKKLAGFVPRPHVKIAGTLPPKVTDVKFWVDPTVFKDHYVLPTSPINMRFLYNKENALKRTPPTEFHIQVQDMASNASKYYTQRANEKPYKLWEKYEEAYTNYVNGTGEFEIENIPNSIVNARLIITPINEQGIGPNSVFILPVSGGEVIHYKMLNEYPISQHLKNNWDYIHPNPRDNAVEPRWLFFYLNTPTSIVENDHLNFQDEKWKVTTPHDNWKEINAKSYRWLIDDGNVYMKYNDRGWIDTQNNENVFIDQMFKIIQPIYRKFLTEHNLHFQDPHVFKLLIPHPLRDKNDMLVLYFMKGVSWQL